MTPPIGALPSGIQWLNNSEAGRIWIRSLPALVELSAKRWHLRLGQPFPYAYTSIALPAQRDDGSDAVLKIQFPDRESEQEALALRHWDGDGAIQLLAHDQEHSALLLERCLPGTPLSQVPSDAALDVLIGLLPRLWKPAGKPPFRSLADEALWWASHLRQRWDDAGRPFEANLIDTALDVMSSLPQSQGEQVLLHQDLHGDNVLKAQREPWLVIDPKPLSGEREFGLAPIVRSFEFGHGRREVQHRFDRLTSELGVNRERARLWCIAQTVAWSVGSDFIERHIETTRWLLEMR
jgi:streptomycin 6-kinase